MIHDRSHDNLSQLASLYFSGAMTKQQQEEFELFFRACEDSESEQLNGLESVASALAELIESAEPPETIRQNLLDRIAADIDQKKEADSNVQVWREWGHDQPSGNELFTLHSDQGEWQETGVEGIFVRRLFVDRENNRMTAMFRMQPGTSYVPHIHDGPEECYVLEGDLHVGDDIVMHAGDYQRAPAESRHGVQATENGCLLLISSSMSDKVE